MTFTTWVVLALTGSSAITDVLRGRIYNVLVLPAAIGGLLLAGVPAWGGSATALGERIAGMLVVTVLFLPFWKCLPGSIGGGDIKLYLALAALLSWRAFLVLLFVSLAGALVMGVLRKYLSPLVAGLPMATWTQHAARPAGVGRIRIGPAVFCAALIYAGGGYG